MSHPFHRPCPTLLAVAFIAQGCSNAGAPGTSVDTSTDLGQIVVSASPIRLTLRDASGATVLTSATDDREIDGTRYAAFGFSTAPEPELTPPSFDAPVEVPASDPATRHVAVRLATTEREGQMWTARFETDDPAGRSLVLTVGPDAEGALRAELGVDPPDGVTGVFASFETAPGEAFHGFGGRRESTDLRGHAIRNWVYDYRFPDVSTSYYYPQPMFLSSAGYAAWVDTDRLASFRMASDTQGAWRVAVAGTTLRLVLAPGDPATSMRTITATTGRHRVAPAFSMGLTPSRTIRLLDETVDDYRAKVADDLAHITTTNLPVTAYAFEGWATMPRDEVVSTIASLRDMGVHPILYIRSFLSDDFARTEPAGRLQEAIDQGYVARTAGGDPYLFKSPFDGSDAGIVDFTNPDARTWWKGLVTEMLELGADGFMNDFGEQVEPDMVFSDGSTGATMHNRYPVLQHRTTREAVDAFVAAHPDREVYFFVRAGYAGRPGSAAYENATFPGDESVDWDPLTGLPSVIPDMLNRSLFGGYGFSTDIGGYADFGGPGTDPELFVRWAQLAAFTTHFRIHNSALSGVRMPWSFDPSVQQAFADAAALHARAVPLMRNLWADAESTGLAPIRPLWLVDPAAEGEAHANDEWMVGTDVLVAPVVTQGATSREVWFPEGCWALHGTGSPVEGPATRTVDAPLDVLPWFTRCDTSPL